MKKIENVILVDDDGKPLEEEIGKEKHIITVVYLIKVLLNNCQYTNRKESRDGDDIYNKIKKYEDAKSIELEDAELNLVIDKANKFEPFLRGRVFSAFFDTLEKAEKVK